MTKLPKEILVAFLLGLRPAGFSPAVQFFLDPKIALFPDQSVVLSAREDAALRLPLMIDGHESSLTTHFVEGFQFATKVDNRI